MEKTLFAVPDGILTQRALHAAAEIGNTATHPADPLSLRNAEHPCKGALKALLCILVMVAGDEFKTGLDRMG